MIFKRLTAFIIDLFIITMIISVPFFATQTIKSQILTQFFSALMVTLLLCKDCINGQSVGKLIMKIQVVDDTTNQKVYVVRCIIRNFFVIFWIVEVVVLFVSKNKRIGDYVAKTKVINNNKAEKIRLDKNTLIAILICFCVIFLLLFFVFNLFCSSTLQLLF
jgi:uncharacterized RDD family membrane protein YckC